MVTAKLDGVALRWASVDEVVGTAVTTQEQAAETRPIRSPSSSPLQSLRYLGMAEASVMVPFSHMAQSVMAVLRFRLSIILL